MKRTRLVAAIVAAALLFGCAGKGGDPLSQRGKVARDVATAATVVKWAGRAGRVAVVVCRARDCDLSEKQLRYIELAIPTAEAALAIARSRIADGSWDTPDGEAIADQLFTDLLALAGPWIGELAAAGHSIPAPSTTLSPSVEVPDP